MTQKNKKPTTEEILEALQQAVAPSDDLVEEPVEGNAELGGFHLRDFADHARGLRLLSEEHLSQIRFHPIRRKLLESFERGYASSGLAAAVGKTIADWLRSWREQVGWLEPMPVPQARIEGEACPPTYKLMIEREGLLFEEDSVQMVFPPRVTERGMLVFQAAFSSAIRDLIELPSIRAELSVFAAAPELSIGRIELTAGRAYVKLPLPAEMRELPQWREISPGGALPFALILHLSEVPLEAATTYLTPTPSRPWRGRIFLRRACRQAARFLQLDPAL